MNDHRQNGISIYTIGHSNRSWEDFIALLEKFAIRTVADIRSLPGSKKFPHFDRENMEKALFDQGLGTFGCQSWAGCDVFEKDSNLRTSA